MSWASRAIETLANGDEVTIRPRGHSMKGKVNDGASVTLVPPKDGDLVKGAVVLVRVKGTIYLHLIKAIEGERFLIGNNKGGINGWVGRGSIFGIAVKINNNV